MEGCDRWEQLPSPCMKINLPHFDFMRSWHFKDQIFPLWSYKRECLISSDIDGCLIPDQMCKQLGKDQIGQRKRNWLASLFWNPSLTWWCIRCKKNPKNNETNKQTNKRVIFLIYTCFSHIVLSKFILITCHKCRIRRKLLEIMYMDNTL